MSTQKIVSGHWTEYFNHLSRVIDSLQVKIELVGLSLGDQTEIDYVDFSGLSYDSDNDIISIHTDELGHHIHQPKEVYVEENDDGLASMQIIDKEGTQHILYFKAKA